MTYVDAQYFWRELIWWLDGFSFWKRVFRNKEFFRKDLRQESDEDGCDETDTSYELDVDLPGYKKEDVSAKLEDGYLTISASRNANNDEKDKEGRYIRRERFTGQCSRSFYVGEGVTQEDIKARFENGILKLSIPKVEKKQVEEKKYISIEG